MFLVNVPEGTVRDDDLCFFAPLIAGHLGLYEAVLVQRLHIDLRQPTYVVDDVPWIERSYAEFSEREEISTTTVSRAMKTLESLEIVRSAKLRKKRWNQTKSYTLSYPHLRALLWDLYKERTAFLESQEKLENS